MPGSDPRNMARNAGGQATATAQRHQGTIKKVGRVGVAAEGVVYLLIGWLALQIALGTAGTSADSTGALRQVAQSSIGPVLLVLLAVGFAALALWQVLEVAFGHDTKQRVKAAFKGIVAVTLGISCVQLLTGSGGSAGQQQQTWTQRLLEAPGGQILVVLVGLAVAAVGIATAVRGLKHKFEEKVEGSLSPGVRALGVAGYVARGVAFTVLGGLVVLAATGDVAKSRGLDAAFHEIASQPFGKIMLIVVALGIAAFGAFQIVTAPRRRKA
ncbi:uncharacterized protein DUF1206 [Kineococcus xinjiangensis]|uniref:Uncharacterized protein DUF1206 n=1 Tax=Kineococcus xinjiangensis TaxID=512762 RepID=A0A2S6IIY6_9ACTN|nr:DUF1206 domain-containing protein [Kineococcus xinjiangensis]PPK94146.1 uncharacterized protein DUF1206 [Kineococcus xinjiangensis]